MSIWEKHTFCVKDPTLSSLNLYFPLRSALIASHNETRLAELGWSNGRRQINVNLRKAQKLCLKDPTLSSLNLSSPSQISTETRLAELGWSNGRRQINVNLREAHKFCLKDSTLSSLNLSSPLRSALICLLQWNKVDRIRLIQWRKANQCQSQWGRLVLTWEPYLIFAKLLCHSKIGAD